MTLIPRGVVVALAIGLGLAACSAQPTATPPSGSAEPTPTGSGLVEHPTGSDVVVLRLDEGLGLVGLCCFGIAFDVHTPTFSLYGAGTAIYHPTEQIGVLEPLPLRKATLAEAQMSALLGFALGAGGLSEARADYPNPVFIDAPTTAFTIRAAGVDRTASIYGLGDVSPQTPDMEMRARFAQLADLLRDFDQQVRAGRATDDGVYVPPAYRVVLHKARPVPSESRQWPWHDIVPQDFVAALDPEGQGGGVITPEQARELSDPPEGGLFPVAFLGPDGIVYMIALRPLLPDETD